MLITDLRDTERIDTYITQTVVVSLAGSPCHLLIITEKRSHIFITVAGTA